jgi:hypothetical protein
MTMHLIAPKRHQRQFGLISTPPRPLRGLGKRRLRRWAKLI